MALDDVTKQYVPLNNDFYRNHYHHVIICVIGLLFLLIIVLAFLFYQVMNRPLPQFNAVQSDGKTMLLAPNEQPNLLPDTILRWASKAATVSYTFDFVNYNNQTAAARPYFTEDGWRDYLSSVNNLINTIIQNKIFVNSVVSGPPVISNQGDIPGRGFVWRVQIPFLVTYQSENALSKQRYFVIISIVKVPTSVNKQGIGIDQFLMV